MIFQSLAAKDLKTWSEKIKNKSYHHRCKFRPILEDGNVNKVSFEMILKSNEPLCLVLKPLKHKQKRVPCAVFDVSSICLQYYLNFCFDSEAIPNPCTTRFITKSYEIPVDPNYPTLQNNRNKIYRIAKKFEKLLAPFQMIEHEIDNDLLTKRSCK